MRLHVLGRVQTGVDMFDSSLGAATVWHTALGGPVLLVNSGRNGGMTAWRAGPSGQLQLVDTLAYGATGTNAARDHLVLVQFRGETVAFFGRGDTTFWGYALNPDGTFGARRLVNFDRATEEIAAGNDGFVQLWAMLRPDAPTGFAQTDAWQGTNGLAFAENGDVVLTSGGSDALHVLPHNAAPQLAGDSIGVFAPTGLVAFSDAGHGARVVVAGGGSSSLSVLRTGSEGYMPTDHMLDTGSTAFFRAQAISGASVATPNGPLDLVLVGGADHGVTLFAVTPEGWLVWLDTVFDTPATGLYNVTTLESFVQDGHLIIAATSGRDAGVTVLRLPLANLGGIAPAGQGGASDDIVIAHAGVTQLTGGGGSNVFVIRPQTGTVTITDFTPGLDRLDLSAWPMLRDVSQLQVQTTATGAVITYRGYDIDIVSDAGTGLTVQDIFPQGLTGADRLIVLSVSELHGAPPPADPPADDPTDPPPVDDPTEPPDTDPPDTDPPDVTPPPDTDPPDPVPEDPTPPVLPTGDGVLQLQTPAGVPLANTLVHFTLQNGQQASVMANGSGSLALPGAPLATVQATRAWDVAAGDPGVTARDALDVLRMAVGVTPSFGPASAQSYIAADINRDGQVTALDALEVLRAAVGLQSATPPRWVFFDAQTDWNALALGRNDTTWPVGLALAPDWHSGDLAMTGILLGAMSEFI
ncbi:hypothetical protein [Roseinatronobacter sp. NSM]|uniref:hypothetical protein n=1 Tax=Roseinatronobacter sp. NSM TaxID=3457785 RepID=UPI004036A26B